MSSFTDDFNRADSSGLGTNWVAISNNFNVSTNAAIGVGTGGSINNARYASAVSTTDHFTQAALSSGVASATSSGVEARMNTGATEPALTCYLWRYTGSATQILKCVSGVFTALGTGFTAALSNGAVLKLQCVGSTITGYINGTQRQQVTDTAVTTGNSGGMRSAGNVVKLDDFQVADNTVVAVAASTLPSLTQAEAGTFVKPTYTATATSTLPSLTQAEAGTFVKPTYTATATSTLPSLTQAEAGTFVKPTYHAVATSTLPSLTQSEAGTFVKPTYHATATSTLPSLTQSEAGTFAILTHTARVVSVLPSLTQSEAGTFAIPIYHVMATSVLPSLTQQNITRALVARPTYYSVLSSERQMSGTLAANRQVTSSALVAARQVTGEFV